MFKNKHVVITRAKSQSDDLIALLKSHGAFALPYPCIEIRQHSGLNLLNTNYDWVIFTSQNAVKSFLPLQYPKGHAKGTGGFLSIAAVGHKTAEAVKTYLNLEAVIVPEKHNAQSLAAALPSLAGKKLLLPQGNLARPTLANLLKAQGALVETVIAYETIKGSGGVMLSDYLTQIDALTFFSPSAVRFFLERIADEQIDIKQVLSIKCVCIGETTCVAAREMGFSLVVVASNSSSEGVVDALL